MSAGLRADAHQWAIHRIDAHRPAAAVTWEAPVAAPALKGGPAFVLAPAVEDDTFSPQFDGG